MEEKKMPEEYIMHHTALKNGALLTHKSKGIIYPYKGKYGTGYVIEKPCEHSTGHKWVTYFIKKK